jgi:hypothetical protein
MSSLRSFSSASHVARSQRALCGLLCRIVYCAYVLVIWHSSESLTKGIDVNSIFSISVAQLSNRFPIPTFVSLPCLVVVWSGVGCHDAFLLDLESRLSLVFDRALIGMKHVFNLGHFQAHLEVPHLYPASRVNFTTQTAPFASRWVCTHWTCCKARCTSRPSWTACTNIKHLMRSIVRWPSVPPCRSRLPTILTSTCIRDLILAVVRSHLLAYAI